jgi:hypothetical protein
LAEVDVIPGELELVAFDLKRDRGLIGLLLQGGRDGYTPHLLQSSRLQL